MVAELDVWLYGRRVAVIGDAGFGQTSVSYTAAAVGDPVGATLSLHLPVRSALYPAATHGTRWVRSLLPEGPALARAVELTGVAEDDRFGLLAALGRDVAGAVRVVPSGSDPGRPDAGYEPFNEEQLADLVSDVRDRPLGLDRDGKVRLSLAGMQDKVLLHRPKRSAVYYLPLHGAASTVIVKPEPSRFPHLATNELFALRLARAAGLDAARARLDRFADHRVLVVDRYDRVYRAGGQVERVHQEDLLTASGRDPLLKYERGNGHRLAEGGAFATDVVDQRHGPTLDELAEALNQHLGPAKGALMLAQVVAFNVVLGNADAHPRNLSLLLHRDGKVTFAPLYDLVCTRLYDQVSATAAQAVGGNDDIDTIEAADLLAHAAAFGVPDTLLRKRVEGVVGRMRDVAGSVAARVAAEQHADAQVADRLGQMVTQRAQRFLA